MRNFLGYRYQVTMTVELELTEEVINEVQAAVFTHFGVTSVTLPNVEKIMAIYEGTWNYPEDIESLQFKADCFIKNYLDQLVLTKGENFEDDDVWNIEHFAQVIDENEKGNDYE